MHLSAVRAESESGTMYARRPAKPKSRYDRQTLLILAAKDRALRERQIRSLAGAWGEIFRALREARLIEPRTSVN